MLLHRTISLLPVVGVSAEDTRNMALRLAYPTHFLRHRDPSWLLRGQITSLSMSVDARNVPGFGGIAWRGEERRREAFRAQMTLSHLSGLLGREPTEPWLHRQRKENRDL